MLISLSEWLGCWSAGITMRFKAGRLEGLFIDQISFF